MTDEAPLHSEPNEPELPADIPWLRATADDFVEFDFEAPIVESKIADCGELSDLYRQAMQTHPEDSAAARVFTFLWSVTGMYFKPVLWRKRHK